MSDYIANLSRSLSNSGPNRGKRIDWIKPYSIISNCSYNAPAVSIKWYEDGTLNASVNCLDRHLRTKADQTAIIWEGDDPSQSKHISYQELYEDVCRFSNVLKSNGVKKGDRVTLYLPMIPEAAVAMLACARIGAVHSVGIWGVLSRCAGRQDCRL
jgi:acetyl-CoA synthetase